jgi:adenine-specific DNA-methyltransferase
LSRISASTSASNGPARSSATQAIPPDDVPEDARRAVKHWSQWIDYWAVDWDNKSDTFHNEWQTYRTRKDKTLALETTHAYAEPGDYTIVVKVIDILGNDTTKTMRVTIS